MWGSTQSNFTDVYKSRLTLAAVGLCNTSLPNERLNEHNRHCNSHRLNNCPQPITPSLHLMLTLFHIVRSRRWSVSRPSLIIVSIVCTVAAFTTVTAIDPSPVPTSTAICTEQCSFFNALDVCPNTSCICSVLAAAGSSSVTVCAECIMTADAERASALLQPFCSTTTTPPPKATPTANCDGPCSAFSESAFTCGDNSCFCASVMMDAPVCSECWASVGNSTKATIIEGLITYCSTFLATASVMTPTATCAAVCDIVSSAILSCSDINCLCPIVMSDGPRCSQCFAAADATDASYIGGFITTCESVLGTTIQPPNQRTSSGGQRSGIDSNAVGTIPLCLITFLSVVAALLSVLSWST